MIICLFLISLSYEGVNVQPILYVFTSDNCSYCEIFKKDYQKNKNSLRSYIDRYFKINKNKHYFEIKYNAETKKWSNQEIVNEFQNSTKRKLRSVPTFWVKNRKGYVSGYNNPKTLLEYLSRGK